MNQGNEAQNMQRVQFHWPEYLMEAAGLATFMFSACAFGVLLEHPASPVKLAVENAALRRVWMGLAMGLTALGIFYSPWGKRSGAHINPSVTLTFFLLGKIRGFDAAFYVIGQFLGGIAGVGLAFLLIGPPLANAAIQFVVTVPGPSGEIPAFCAEFLISFLMMITVLLASNSKLTSRYVPLFAGFLVAAFIALESPVSGMSMNPARTFGSAVFANDWHAIWIYFTAPLLGMTFAGQLYRFRKGVERVFCAKLHHHRHTGPCIFHCNYGELHGHR